VGLADSCPVRSALWSFYFFERTESKLSVDGGLFHDPWRWALQTHALFAPLSGLFIFLSVRKASFPAQKNKKP